MTPGWKCRCRLRAPLLYLLSLTLTTVSLPALSQAPERADIPERYRWDLRSMYTSFEAWEADIARLEQRMPAIRAYEGRLSESGETLLEAIGTYESLNRLLARIYVYAGLKSFEDMRLAANSARFSRAQSLSAELQSQTAFMTPEIVAIPESRLKALIAETPGLQIYRHFLDEQTRLRPFTLSPAEEELLARAADPLGRFSLVFGALDNADLDLGEVVDEEGERVPLTKALYNRALSSPDRRFREAAWKGLFRAYERHGNTLAANYEGHVKGRIFTARARGFDSALQAATYSSAIPEEVYYNTITSARKHAGSLQRYLELRRITLGLDSLQVWDLYAPMVISAQDRVEFEEAKTLVAQALTPLGEAYIAQYWKGFEEGWVDAFETAGKRGGAYSWGTYDSKPYLSMNFAGTLDDVSTLAHEYGHSLHRWLSSSTQPYIYGSYRTFIAEIASMTNEAILFQKMLAGAESARQRAYLLENYLDRFRGSFFRQASLADFEMRAHARAEAGEALDRASLDKLYAEVFNDYYGESVHTDPLNDLEWSRIPHFLRTDNFYVYQYATSFVAANALARNILEEGEPARERFLTLLRSGSSDYPIELLRRAGVDMTRPEPIREAMAIFDQMVDELEATLAEL